MIIEEEYSKAYIRTATTTNVFIGKGNLHSITINGTSTGTISLQDNGTNFAVIGAVTVPVTLFYKATIASTLSIVTAAATDITVSFRNH